MTKSQLNNQETLSKEDRHAEQIELDSRSIFVRNVSVDITPESLEEYFMEIGVINRVTILYNKHTRLPKGCAYIEFIDKSSVEKALSLHNTLLNGNKITVSKKRTNLPGFNKLHYHHLHTRSSFDRKSRGMNQNVSSKSGDNFKTPNVGYGSNVNNPDITTLKR